jgi:hypothetical protein
MNKWKWETWHDNLPKHTQEYLKTAPIWRDSDLAKFCAITFLVGLTIGVVLTWH